MLQLTENQPSICSDSLILTYVLSLSGYKEKTFLGLFLLFPLLPIVLLERGHTLEGMKS